MTTDASGQAALIPPELTRSFEGLNVVEPDTLQLLHPMDGERFLRALPHIFRSYRLIAELEDGPTPDPVPAF